MRPLVGITADLADGTSGPRVAAGLAYCRCVEQAGGLPVVLPPVPELATEHAVRCDAFVFIGGDDPRTEPFGEPTHPKATPVRPDRQAYETALLGVLRDELGSKPVLGVCLGMQMMALVAGGRLDQHMPETTPTHAAHKNALHPVRPAAPHGVLRAGDVWSNHRQAVCDPGTLAVLARAPDDVIEAIGDPRRPFYLGVQWHPERTTDPVLGAGVFAALVAAAR
jgi:putative glutamine amidotransferase